MLPFGDELDDLTHLSAVHWPASAGDLCWDRERTAREQVERKPGIAAGHRKRQDEQWAAVVNVNPGHLERRHAEKVHAPDADTQRHPADEDERSARASARQHHATGEIEPNA